MAASVGGNPGAPRLLAGTGADRVHLLVVCTAERGLCGPFNSAIVRLARERANALLAEGKDVKIFCVGRKGRDQLKRLSETGSSRPSICVRCDRSSSKTPTDRAQDRGPVRGRRVRRLHPVLHALQIGDGAGADRPTADPGSVSRQRRRRSERGLRVRARRRGHPRDLLPRNISVQIFRALLENAGLSSPPR